MTRESYLLFIPLFTINSLFDQTKKNEITIEVKNSRETTTNAKGHRYFPEQRKKMDSWLEGELLKN